jgi:phenylpropionate dioxygenase-like ring-hydroxylating dioxygenase large terminal subunit
MEVQVLNINPLIQPKHYHDKDVFENEQTLIFEKQWAFAGFLFDLQKENDFITTQIGGKSIVIQNIKGEIKAFLNVCSHRFSKIQCEVKGNRALVCPYHGWAYNAKGLPLGIPRKPNFGILTKEKLQELALEEYNLELCGQLVFVKKQDGSPESLSSFLGYAYQMLIKVSEAFGKMIDLNEMVVNANWKIVVENTLEAYHINQVHTTTFKPIFGEQKEFNRENIHTSIQVDLHTDFQKIEGMYESRPYKFDGYFHLFIFPNFTIASSYGSSFSLQHFVPINATQTNFVSYVFQTKLENYLSRKEQVMLNAMNESIVDFNRTVFNEDKYICERVQEGVSMTNKLGILSTEEERVLEFHKAYKNLMNNE